MQISGGIEMRNQKTNQLLQETIKKCKKLIEKETKKIEISFAKTPRALQVLIILQLEKRLKKMKLIYLNNK